MYETERTSDRVGKILWPGHLVVYQKRTNPKCSSISFAMPTILSMRAKAKGNNLKLEDNIPNIEQEKPHKMPEKESTQNFNGFIFAVSFECSKLNFLSSMLFPLLLCHTSLILFFYFQILLLYVNIVHVSLKLILVKQFLCFLYENKRAALYCEFIFVLYQQSKVVSNSICHTSHSQKSFLPCDFS